MAEAAQKQDQSESMEEILQSIKRIMDNDETEEPKKTDNTDVFELTEIVKEDGTIAKDTKMTSPKRESPPELIRAAESEEGLMSDEASNAAANSLRKIAESSPRDYSIPRIPSPEFRSGNNVEDLVLEALRPMLKDWLDENLPIIVQKIVEKEVKRIVDMYRD
ncbi:MAG: DUF2497 domain-containing protein [Pseudomonadota bacterium]